MTMKIIKQDKSVIPSLDVDTIERMREIVEETCSIDGIGAYKIGFELVIPYGMQQVTQTIREITDIPIIYDHQKAATDIPDTGLKFVQACKKSGADAVIFFPQSGPATELEWIKAANEEAMPVIVGGEMTHPKYMASDEGFISDDAPRRIYEIAARNGVLDFVVPGNKPERIMYYRHLLESLVVKPTLYSPGLISQGGKLSESAKAAGERWHAIIGRAIYNAKNIKAEAAEICKALMEK